jgi:hypothetical protein
MTIIVISKGLHTAVDDDVLDLFSTLKWQAMYDSHTKKYYARCHQRIDGKDKTVLIHRIIMGAKKGEIVDHINGNTLDNRRQNLRICTNAENCRNKKIHSDNQNGFKGIRKHKNFWQAKVTKDYKDYYAGSFKTPLEAAIAYNKKAKELFGEFAKLNVISSIIN